MIKFHETSPTPLNTIFNSTPVKPIPYICRLKEEAEMRVTGGTQGELGRFVSVPNVLPACREVPTKPGPATRANEGMPQLCRWKGIPNFFQRSSEHFVSCGKKKKGGEKRKTQAFV